MVANFVVICAVSEEQGFDTRQTRVCRKPVVKVVARGDVMSLVDYTSGVWALVLEAFWGRVGFICSLPAVLQGLLLGRENLKTWPLINTLPLEKFRKNSYFEDILSQKLCLLSCCDPFSYKRFSSTTDFTEKPCTIIHFFLKKHLGKVALVDVLLTKSLPVSKRTSWVVVYLVFLLQCLLCLSLRVTLGHTVV